MTNDYDTQFAEFARNVATHTVIVLHDDGVYRHLWCAAEGFESFEIITWPGYLCFAGDMGCFTFAHPDTPDMFELFRGRRTAGIDRAYLADQVVASGADDMPRFWWCGYAIPWAIEQYDALKETSQSAPVKEQ